MGRLLRKKTSVKKKKSINDTGLSEPGLNGSDTKQAGAVSGPVTKTIKQPAVPSKVQSVSKSFQIKKDKNFLDKSFQFLREVRIELKKVTWPTRKQTLGSTAVVIFFVVLISVFLGLVDFSLSNLIRLVLR